MSDISSSITTGLQLQNTTWYVVDATVSYPAVLAVATFRFHFQLVFCICNASRVITHALPPAQRLELKVHS